MKLNFKLSLKPPFIIQDVSKRLSKDDGHWSDDWGKAVYKIKNTQTIMDIVIINHTEHLMVKLSL